MINFGAVPAGSVLPIMFNTYAAATGASVTLTGLAVTDIEVYKGTSMTQRASDAGFVLLDTDGIDIDGTTGIHGFSIDTGDNTDASFYAVGSFFTVVVSAVTVDSQTVNFVAATFRLVAAEAIAGKPKADVDAWLGTAAATPATAGHPVVTHKVGTGTGELAITAGAVKIQTGLKKAQALSNFPFLMTDSTNHNPATGLTVTATRSLDGAAFGAGTIANMTEVSNGIYQCDLATGDTNGDTVVLRFTASGADDLFVTLITEP